MARSAIDESGGFSVPAIRGQFPIESIGSAAAGIGHLNQLKDVDGAVRDDPLLVNYYGKAVPSMALLAAASSLNLGPGDIRINAGESVQIGKLRIKTDDMARMLPQFYKGKDGRPAFAVDSFYDVLSGKIPASKYRDKIVLVGATAAGVGTQFATPGYPGLYPAEMLAHITSSILGEHFIVQPSWGVWAESGRVPAGGRLPDGAAAAPVGRPGRRRHGRLLLLLVGGEFALLSGASMWLKFMLPATLLVIGHLALTTRRYLVTEAGKLKSDDESAETNRMMGLALQGQGQLDMAFDRFRRVPMSDAVMENLYNLALDFERKRQFNKAEAVYEHMAAWNKDFKDLKAKLNRAKNLSETVILGGGGSHPGGTMLLDGGAVEKPMLGRYQIEKELGKGAMGVVYLGKDPKIGRVVAIKTMALSQEFEGEELTDARERFFREAETAGRLQHQNIVTIFDAGEEHDLAYIAMEFLKGKDLVDFCKPGQSAAGAQGDRDHCPGGRGAGLCPSPERGAPRHQARQHHVRGRQRHGQGHRLRHRADHRLEQDQDRPGAGHAQLHVARADRRQEGGRPIRPVLAGRDAVPDADRGAAVPRRFDGRTDVQDRQRRGAGRARAAPGDRPSGWPRWWRFP